MKPIVTNGTFEAMRERGTLLQQKSVFISVLGQQNSGKSSLLNTLIGLDTDKMYDSLLYNKHMQLSTLTLASIEYPWG